MIPATMVAVLALVIAGIFALTAWSVARRKRTPDLRKRFGPEYEYALQHYPDRHSAEADLRQREERMRGVPIHPLRPEEREQWAARWQDIQARFVDNPLEAFGEAEELIREVLLARGYPPARFETQVENLSVDHPDCARRYREAHEIASGDGPAASTIEELRRAFFTYRAVFEELVEVQHVP